MRGKREVHTNDMEVGQRPPLIVPDTNPLVRDPEEIVVAGTQMNTDIFDELAFNEEYLTILIQRSSEKYAPKMVMAGVNGRNEWYPTNEPVRIKRKFVEVLVRSKPDSIRAFEIPIEGENPENKIERTSHSAHPISVMHDPNPKGYEWLRNLMHDY